MFFKTIQNSTLIEEKQLTRKIADFDEETKKLLKIEMAKYNLNSLKIHESKKLLMKVDRSPLDLDKLVDLIKA